MFPFGIFFSNEDIINWGNNDDDDREAVNVLFHSIFVRLLHIADEFIQHNEFIQSGPHSFVHSTGTIFA